MEYPVILNKRHHKKIVKKKAGLSIIFEIVSLRNNTSLSSVKDCYADFGFEE
jgi:hypothetical protein